MKKHLINLLLEEYKQQCLFDELQSKGIALIDICVNNLDIVLDIIGFPKDNSDTYGLLYLGTDGNIRDEQNKIVNNELFCRDWLTQKHCEMFDALSTQQKVCVTDKGLQIESGVDSETIRAKLQEYIEWLYSEFERLYLR